MPPAAQSSNKNVFTGFEITFGRPNWNKVLDSIYQYHPEPESEIGVFYCGPQKVWNDVSEKIAKHSTKCHKFCVHAEVFG